MWIILLYQFLAALSQLMDGVNIIFHSVLCSLLFVPHFTNTRFILGIIFEWLLIQPTNLINVYNH